jgi:glycosyltransferase involved in cell wall biosynthesis
MTVGRGNEPLVSVIIPAYNRAHTVAETVDSVLGQTYGSLEVIVVDDGSKDGTQEVLRGYGARIKNIWQPNAGQMVARNRGIAEASGEIVTFLDSDDIWLPTCVERHVNVLGRTGADVPCSLANGWLEFSDGRRITSFQNSELETELEEGLWLNVPDILPVRFVMFCQFVAIRRAALKVVKGFDEDLKYMEDYALPLRLSLLGPWAFIREPLVVWRQGAADSVSVSQRALKQARPLRESLLVIRKRYLESIAGQKRYAKARKLQERGLWQDQVELRAISLRERGAKLRGDLLFNAVRYQKAILRRLPTYPKMKAVRLGA